MLLIEIGFVAIVALSLAAVLVMIALAARRAGRDAATLTRRAALALAAWLAVTGGAAAAGLLRADAGPQRVLPLALIAGVGAILLSRTPTGRALVDAAPRAGVIALQLFRVPVELVLWRLFVAGVVPVQMTFEGRNLDVLTGLTAVPVALAAWGGARRAPRLAIAWHLGGLALLANIVAIAIASAPGPLRAFGEGPANTIIGQAPFVWLPAVLVPLAMFGHVVGLRQALAARRAAAPRPSVASAGAAW